MSNKKLQCIDDINLGIKITYDKDNEFYGECVEINDADFRSCPKCESVNIVYDIREIEPDSMFVYRIHGCNDCNTRWEERYDLVKVTIFEGAINEADS